jgi:CDP-diglyceride synthetase
MDGWFPLIPLSIGGITMKSNHFKLLLSALAMITFLICLYLLFFRPFPEGSKDVLLIVVGALITIVKDVYGYYFGSSEGSARKTDLLAAPNSVQGGAVDGTVEETGK